jgi:hypothetical protein
MPAAFADLAMEQGATWTPPLITLMCNGSPFDLTDATASLEIFNSDAGGTPLLTLTGANGGLALGGTAGTIQPAATATQTADLVTSGLDQTPVEVYLGTDPSGNPLTCWGLPAYYQLAVTKSGVVYYVLRGQLAVSTLAEV